MNIDYIALVVFGASLIALTVVVARKIRFLRTIDVSLIHRDRLALIKEDLIASRLARKFTNWWHCVAVRTQPGIQRFQKGFQNLLGRVETLEREYRVRSMIRQAKPEPETIARVEALLEEAVQFMKDGVPEKAEQKYIEIVSLQPKNAQAFQGLGEVYLQKKDYEHAKESLKHAAKLSPRVTSIYLDLADVYRLGGALQKALEQCRRAVALEPNDPKSLHALLDVSIEVGNRQIAASTLKQFETANPENQRLAEYRERVAAMK